MARRTGEDLRRYLCGYLGRPQWRGRTYDAIKNQALLPDDDDALGRFFQKEAERIAEIRLPLRETAEIDAEIDEKLLDIYKITAPADRARILGSAPATEDDDTNADTPEEADASADRATGEA